MSHLSNYNCECCEGYYTLSFTKISDIFSGIEKVARKLWSRDKPKGNKAYDLDKEIMHKEFDSLFDAVSEGVGRPVTQMAYSDTRLDTVQRLRTNLVTFVAFKNYNQRAAMIKELVDEKGNIRTYAAFKSKCQSLSQEFNENWLNAEYNTTVSATQSAVKWKTFQSQKHLFPYLTYMTQGDGKVRDSHRNLHKITKHIDSPFWDRYMPPNGWRCRCYVLQSKGNESVESPTLDDVEQPPLFRFNPGKEVKAFTKDHPYFKIRINDKKEVLSARNEFYKDKKFYDRIGNINVHVSNYVSNQDFQHELTIGHKVSNYFGIDDLHMNTQIDNEGVTLPDFFNSKIVVEYKNTTTTDRRNLASMALKGLKQIKKSQHADKDKYLLIRVSDKVDRQRLINTIYKFESGFNILFIDQQDNISIK